jgi:hypothetical protein
MGFFYTVRETVPGLSVTKKRFTALPSGLVLTLTLWMLSIPSPIASLKNLYHTHAGVEGIEVSLQCIV